MLESVTDVGLQRSEDSVDDSIDADWSIHAERRGGRTHDPVRRDHVVQVGDVIAVQVSDDDAGQHHGQYTRTGHAHDDRASRIDEQSL